MPFDLCEMKGNVDILYLIGVYRYQRESLYSLWSPGPSGRAIFFASFDRNRFEQLLANLILTVVDIVTRIISLLHFGKCGNSFLRITDAVSAYVTVYEQLRSFLDRL